jgi:hypothetical protein
MTLSEWLDILTKLMTILGFPIALFVFINDRRIERKEREYGTYHALDEKYQEFLRLCVEYPRFNLYDVPLENPPDLSEQEKKQQAAVFDILVSLLERAFLMYRDQSNKVKKAQWVGWTSYMRDYSQHQVFKEIWMERGIDFDVDFTSFMNGLINSPSDTE